MQKSLLVPDYITRTELAFHLRVSPRTIKRWSEKGKLPPSILLGSTVLFKRREVEAALKSISDDTLSLKVA